VPDDEFDHDKMESLTEVQDALGPQLAQDELLEKKIAGHDLDVVRYSEEEEKKQLLHDLVDVSGSMTAGFFTTRTGHTLTNADMARVITLSVLIHCAKDQQLFFMRPFEGAPGPLLKATTPDELKNAIDKINHQWFDGGSTNIQAAIMQAMEDIEQTDDLKKAEILVISDAQDSVDVAEIKKLKQEKNIKINFLLVGHSGQTKQFQDISDRFLKCDFGKNGVFEVVDILADATS
jgi:uncharacterized protein with von Willebrand factor type A (vWA) domain